MFTSLIAVTTFALAAPAYSGGLSSTNGYSQDVDTGSSCCYEGLRHCQQDQGDWGCVQIVGGGPNCVDQTQNCDDACLNSGYGYPVYAYQRTRSNDDTCICTTDDASQEDYSC